MANPQQFQLDVRDDGRFNALTQELREIAPEAGSLELRVRSVLVLPPLAPPAAQALVLLPDPTSTTATRRVRVDVPPDARAILLEEWTLALDRTQAQRPPHGEDPYPGVYKQAIALVRSLYALLRYVPAWQLHRKLGPGAPLHIAVGAALAPDVLDEDVLGFGESVPRETPTRWGSHLAPVAHRLVPDDPGPSTFAFPAITTPLGAIILRTQYRPHTRFRLDPLENLWSSAFASPSGTPPSTTTPVNQTSPLSGGNPNTAVGRTPSSTSPARVVDLDTPAFTPTLLSSRQRASLSGSGSPLRHTPASIASNLASNPNPNLPGGNASFSPIRTRTVSQLSTGPLPRSPPASPRLGMGMDFTSAGTGIGGGAGGASGLTRTRRESLLTGARSGTSTPADTGPSTFGGAGSDSPRRTPSTINAFKSNTLASSPRALALGAGMGGGGAGSPLGMGGSPRTTPGLGLGTSPRMGAVAGTTLGGSPGGRRSIDSAAGESVGPSNLGGGTGGSLSVQPQPIKRYSSSFGHRPGRSEGSLGSGGVGSLGAGGAGVGVGSAGTGTGTGGSPGAGSIGTGGEGVTGVSGTSAESGNPAGGHARKLTTIGVSAHVLLPSDVLSNKIEFLLNCIPSLPNS